MTSPSTASSAAPRQATWVEVDLARIEANVRHLARLAAVPLMAVVKANGYGHGAEAVARAAVEAGADWLGVAFSAEGVALRHAGLTAPVLVLGYTPPHLAAEAIEHNLSLAVFDPEAIILGGGVAEGLAPRWDALIEAVQERALPRYASGVPVELTTLGDDVGLFGAAIWALGEE